MTEARERYERVQRRIDNAMRLYGMVARLPDEQLETLRAALEVLSPEDLDEAMTYVIGLAAWRIPTQQSADATQATPDTTG